MALPEPLKSKVLFKPKHWFPIDLEIELVYRLNLKVFQFLPEFCENGVLYLLWFSTNWKYWKYTLKYCTQNERKRFKLYLDYFSCCFWLMSWSCSHSLCNTFSKSQAIIPNFCKTKVCSQSPLKSTNDFWSFSSIMLPFFGKEEQTSLKYRPRW